MSQIKKYYSIKKAAEDYSQLKNLDGSKHESLELIKIEAASKTGILPAVGFDATSSVCQHWGILSGDVQMMIDSNVIRPNNNTDYPTGKDMYTILLNTTQSIRGIHKEVANRDFMKSVVMKWGYSSDPKEIAYNMSKDMDNPNSL
mgnify:CR=1 FL=1